MSDVIMRNVKPEDNAALIVLVHDTLKEFGATKGDGFAMDDDELLDMNASYQLKGKHYLVLVKDGLVLGGAGIAPLDGEEDSGVCELRKMYFSPKLRGKGMGKKMIDACIIKAKKMGYHSMYLETIPQMKIAQKLYVSCGFKYLKRRMGKTGHHACPVFMLKKL